MQVISVAGALLKRFGDTALPYAEALVQQHLSVLLFEPGRSPEDRWTALMLVSDMIEHAPSSGKHLPSLMPKFLECALVDNKDLCNVSCYCLGVVAQKHPAVRPSLESAPSLAHTIKLFTYFLDTTRTCATCRATA
jgi:hypothetical protein